MPWKVKITASAKADIKGIKKWYREQSLQAVENFTKELVAGIESLEQGIIEYKMVHGNYKRLLLKKFPYIIYYLRRDKESVVEIRAVLHNKRNSDFISKRLNE